ncbi:putative flavoprotein involved in K+ transport [Nitrosomonas eutropha]|uniref:flavin-containing monooxygenase n=1 Tax=Nitrosomonas TaxID=914 RepID=UPI0008957129|nr:MULTISPECIES: NAD(P)/FAD-dependent oxidoreductase [Nitrosomonas]MXS79589.1 NAD(P)/FAD-dependent oxidoreductase [Nitrosomonas sp. GH22]SDW20975.1 putative flavoprotein involved in K+ transport [Nitrosomonas eutropha]
MNTSDIHDVAIVGAGPAGLSAAHELTKAGFTPLVLERTPAVGDVWRNHYDGLRLNTGRFCSALPGNKFPLSAGGWPSRDEVVALLENMPERGGFTVQTSIEIEKIRYDHERDIWQITSIDNQQFESRAVVIATGTNRIPVIPEWEGKNTFAGKIIHSSQFKNAQEYADKHVLVVGSGNSSAEIASRLAEYASSVIMSVRTPPQLLPKSILGIPFVGLGIVLRQLPNSLADSVLSFLRHTMIGDLSAYGLPSPTMSTLKQYAINNVVPILYRPFVDDIRAGRIKIVGPIQKISGGTVEVLSAIPTAQNTNPGTTTLQPDIIVAGTGFRTGFPELIQISGITDEKGRAKIAGDQEFPDAPRLYFIGQVNPLSGQLNEIRLEADKIARKLSQQLGTRQEN